MGPNVVLTMIEWFKVQLILNFKLICFLKNINNILSNTLISTHFLFIRDLKNCVDHIFILARSLFFWVLAVLGMIPIFSL